jgi:hypothetical protein
MVDARAIPGTDHVVCIYGACHDLPWGAMAVVDRSKGLEGNAPILHMWPESGRKLVSPDDDTHNLDLGVFGPLPLAARKKPPAIPNAVDYSKNHGYLYVNNVYLGAGDEMAGVKRGSIKYLRIIEAPPRRTFDERETWGIDASQVTAMNWNLTNNKRILGDIPVEADGSAYFQLPADTFVQIHALDENVSYMDLMSTPSTTGATSPIIRAAIHCLPWRTDGQRTRPFSGSTRGEGRSTSLC